MSTSYGDEVTHGIDGEYRYDIDAPGGYDLPASSSVRHNPGEAEVAFPGGIAPSFIRGGQLWGVDPNTMEEIPVSPYIPNPHYTDWRTR